MQELVYLLKVKRATEVEQAVARRLMAQKAPSHVRLATLAPLSNYGFPSGAEGGLLGISNEGLVVGADGDGGAPTLFVPWQNVSYLGDGTLLAKETKAGAGGAEEKKAKK